MPITVCIVEDDRRTRESLVELLRKNERLLCLAAYPSGEEALKGIEAQQPDVALVDIGLSGMTGIECVRKLKLRMPKLEVLMLTAHEDSDLIFESLRAGAVGYLLKHTAPKELLDAIEQLHSGAAPMSTPIARKVVEHFHRFPQPGSDVETLTPREREILTLLAKGYRYKEITDSLALSMSTVRTHLKHIYTKLHVQSRTEAAMKFVGRE
jgi:DNA-binding NarL/FixJ family response regulator